MFYEKRYECENPKSQATLHDSVNDNATMKRIENHHDLKIRNLVMKEGERIKEIIRRRGLAAASYLMLIGRD